MIAGRDVQKVYITDDYTATGIAGTAAIAVEFARLYAVELEHYEKLEGVPLTFAGKVNRLAIMVRGNLAAAMQGLVALPLLAGFDIDDPDPEKAGPHRLVRRRRRLEPRGRGLPVGRFGFDLRRSRRSRSCTRKSPTRIRRCGSPSRRSTTPPMTTRPPAGPTWSAASSRPRSPSAPTARSTSPSSASPSWPARSSKARSRADTFGPDAERAGSDS